MGRTSWWRTPNTEGIGLELAGIETTNSGHPKVNERLATTAADTWAVRDCAGSPHFTHIAFDDFRIVRDNLNGGQRVATGRQMPRCLFTDPIGAGWAQRIGYRLAKLPMAAVLRTGTLSGPRGLMKTLIDTESERILGFMAFGVGAGDVMAVVQVAMSAAVSYTALRDAIFMHPAMAGWLVGLFSMV